MDGENRRAFLKTCTAAGLFGLATGWDPERSSSEQKPSMCIARCKNRPKENEGTVEEGERLIRGAMAKLGGMSRFVSKGDVVWLKPNICYDRTPEQAINSNPDVVRAVVKLCREAGAKEVLVSNNPTGNLSRAFTRSGISAATKEAGGKVFIMDPQKFKTMPIQGKAIQECDVYTQAVEADKLITIATVKHHPYCKMTLGMKGLMGLIAGARYKFHDDLDNSIPDLAAFLEPDLVILDAIRVLKRNGPFGAGPEDVERKDIVAVGTDQVAIDAFGATLLEHKPAEIGYIKEANSRGMGTMDFASLSPDEFVL